MSIVDVVRWTTDERFIRVPYFHRAQIALIPGVIYQAVFISSTTSKKSEADVSMPQIVITPFSFRDWNHLWRIKCAFKERAGVVHDIVTILKDYRLDIKAEVSRGIELNQYHYVELIISSLYWEDKLTKDGVDQLLDQFVRTLLVTHIDYIQFRRVGNENGYTPILTHERMTVHKFLWENYNSSSRPIDPEYIEAKKKTYKNGKKDIAIEIPPAWYKYLVPLIGHKEGENIRYIIHSNSNDQIMSIYFPPKNLKLFAMRVRHKDHIGALAAITGELRRQGITLVSTVTRKHDIEFNQFEFVGISKNDPLTSVKVALDHEEVLSYVPTLETPPPTPYLEEWGAWKVEWDHSKATVSANRSDSTEDLLSGREEELIKILTNKLSSLNDKRAKLKPYQPDFAQTSARIEVGNRLLLELVGKPIDSVEEGNIEQLRKQLKDKNLELEQVKSAKAQEIKDAQAQAIHALNAKYFQYGRFIVATLVGLGCMVFFIMLRAVTDFWPEYQLHRNRDGLWLSGVVLSVCVCAIIAHNKYRNGFILGLAGAIIAGLTQIISR
jgi:hypothetical protein